MKPLSCVGTATIAIVATLLLTSSAISVAASTQVTFNAIQNLSGNSGASRGPVVAASGQYVYVAWGDSTGGTAQTWVVTSNNYGAAGSWGTITKFTGLSGAANTNLNGVQIAHWGSYVYLTWLQGGSTAFAASTDNGQTWSAAKTLPNDSPGSASAEAVATNGTSVYLLWGNHASGGATIIDFAVSHDAGVTFSATQVVGNSNVGTACSCGFTESEVAAVGDYVYGIWDGPFFSYNQYNSHNNPGLAFSTPVDISAAGCVFPCLSREPMIAASGSNVYLTFTSNVVSPQVPNGNYEAYINVSHDNGKTFSGATDVTDTLQSAREVQVAATGSNVYVSSNGANTYISVSNNNGGSFTGTPTHTFSGTGKHTSFATIGVDGSNAYVFWGGTNVVSQMFLGASQDSGATWTTPQQVSSSTQGVVAAGDPGGSQGPFVAGSNGHVFTVWEDLSTGNGDIYFRGS